MATYAEKKALREQGMTYREIGEKLGISWQAAHYGIGRDRDGDWFHPMTEKNCVFPGLRKWMNENRVVAAELSRRIGRDERNGYAKLLRVLRGEQQITKDGIDDILRVTGMKYEEAFADA